MFAGHRDVAVLTHDDWLKEVIQFMPRNWQKVQEILEKHAEDIKAQNEKLRAQGKLRVYYVGDQVYALDHESSTQKLHYKTKPTWIGPFKVKAVISEATYELEDERNGATFVAWNGHIKMAHDRMISQQQNDESKDNTDEKELEYNARYGVT